MSIHESREARTMITTFAAGAVSALVIGLGAVSLGACSLQGDLVSQSRSQVEPAAGEAGSGGDAVAADTDTIELVDAAFDVPAASGVTAAEGPVAGAGDRPGLRARLLRALHATWVTQGQNGYVTHQAIRGEVTAVSATSITVKAKDGVSITYAVTADTRVRERAAGKGKDSTIGAVKVGQKALVSGVGATNPTARVVVFRSTTAQPATSPSPSATS